MPVNHYFQGGNGIGSDAEKRLYENLDNISSPKIKSLFTIVLGK